jgi:hypothetical protein
MARYLYHLPGEEIDDDAYNQALQDALNPCPDKLIEMRSHIGDEFFEKNITVCTSMLATGAHNGSHICSAMLFHWEKWAHHFGSVGMQGAVANEAYDQINEVESGGKALLDKNMALHLVWLAHYSSLMTEFTVALAGKKDADGHYAPKGSTIYKMLGPDGVGDREVISRCAIAFSWFCSFPCLDPNAPRVRPSIEELESRGMLREQETGSSSPHTEVDSLIANLRAAGVELPSNL